MYKEVIKTDSPLVLIITPLRKEDQISKDTLESIGKSKVKFDWISYSSKLNPVQNCKQALIHYPYELPPYIMKLDNDITASDGWLDGMYTVLRRSDDKVAYAYTKFRFTGHLKVSFSARPFDNDILKQRNYISYNSLIKTGPLMKIGGFVDLEGQDRLWDWALWLKFLQHGYEGVPVFGVSFEAYASLNSISCKSHDNYIKNYQLIKRVMGI